MPDYRRANVQGGTYFFTVVTYRRQQILCTPHVREALREGVQFVRALLPFTIDSWVLLPDHLHCIWELPLNDAGFAKRWALIKRFVTKRCRASLYRQKEMSPSKQRRNEATLWQRRYWEHLIRDEEDLNRHRDYLHWNPVKHGYVSRVADWEYSTFHRFVRQGFYPRDWGGRIEETEESKFFGE